MRLWSESDAAESVSGETAESDRKHCSRGAEHSPESSGSSAEPHGSPVGVSSVRLSSDPPETCWLSAPSAGAERHFNLEPRRQSFPVSYSLWSTRWNHQYWKSRRCFVSYRLITDHNKKTSFFLHTNVPRVKWDFSLWDIGKTLVNHFFPL